MSELINNSNQRKKQLKSIILQLHAGENTENVRQNLLNSLSNIPYGEVVEVEQELIAEGLPEEEVLRLCDAHSAVLHGSVDLSTAKTYPDGHPVDVFVHENRELKKVVQEIFRLIGNVAENTGKEIKAEILQLRAGYNQLMDADKHYQRKEYLLFPYLEQLGITGPPKVMWGKHDEIRDLLKASIEILQTEGIDAEDLLTSAEIILIPAAQSVQDMTSKEEEILFPMALDQLTEADWYEISKQSLEIGFCLYDPSISWRPDWVKEKELSEMNQSAGKIQLPSGNMNMEELLAIFNHLPIDITFVDKDDKVKYFSQSKERIFQRNRAILNRDVRHCHPPASAHIVDKIIDDFKSGKESRAPFWIRMGGKMIHIEYFALRSEEGEYLGTLEVSHNIQPYRDLEGEQRILSYTN